MFDNFKSSLVLNQFDPDGIGRVLSDSTNFQANNHLVKAINQAVQLMGVFATVSATGTNGIQCWSIEFEFSVHPLKKDLTAIEKAIQALDSRVAKSRRHSVGDEETDTLAENWKDETVFKLYEAETILCTQLNYGGDWYMIDAKDNFEDYYIN